MEPLDYAIVLLPCGHFQPAAKGSPNEENMTAQYTEYEVKWEEAGLLCKSLNRSTHLFPPETCRGERT